MPNHLHPDVRRQRQDQVLEQYAASGVISKAACPWLGRHYAWLRGDAEYARRFAEATADLGDTAKRSPRKHPSGYKVTVGKKAEERPSKQEAVLAALSENGIVRDAAAKAGVSAASYYAWYRDDPQFRARADAILGEAEFRRQQVILQRASVASKAAWTPERREEWGAHQRASWTPEMREAAAQRNVTRLADPDYKADWLAKSRASREFAACDNPSYFDAINTPDRAYWLGFIATDGYVTGFKSGSLLLGVKLARRDREHLVALHHTLRAKRPIRDYEERVKLPQGGPPRVYPASKLSVCSPQIVNALVGHGITPRKTNVLLPWDGPSDLMPHYWRGVIDGDGHITIGSDGIQVGLAGSEALLVAFIDWAHAVCGTKCTPRQPGNGGRHRVTSIGGTRMPIKLLAALYDDAPVALARKKALADLAVHGKPLQSSLF